MDFQGTWRHIMVDLLKLSKKYFYELGTHTGKTRNSTFPQRNLMSANSKVSEKKGKAKGPS
jgi:hypothetical protein